MSKAGDLNGGPAPAGAQYKQMLEYEKHLRNLLQTKGPSDPNVRTLRSLIRESYEAVILGDAGAAKLHDVEQALWRLHYKQIEEFRGRIRKLTAASSGEGAPSQQATAAKAVLAGQRDPLQKTVALYRSFLAETSGFYHELINKLKARHNLGPDEPFPPLANDLEAGAAVLKPGEDSGSILQCRLSCHRCLIYLGDLARYKELQSDKDVTARKWSTAAGYYLQASHLWPAGGNPHNQLAVLATYVNDELLAVYRYYRSLAVDTPFLTARENLVLLFEKNRIRYAQLRQAGDVQPAVRARMEHPPSHQSPQDTLVPLANGALKLALRSSSQTSGKVAQLSPSEAVELGEAFKICAVRLNGIIFSKIGLETFPDAMESMLQDLDQLLLLQAPALEAALFPDIHGGVGTGLAAGLLQLVAVNIFTVHNIDWTPEGQQPSYAEVLHKSALVQHALGAAYLFSGHLLQGCGTASIEASSPFLPAILTFLEWLASCPSMLQVTKVEEASSLFWQHCFPLLNRLMEVQNGRTKTVARLDLQPLELPTDGFAGLGTFNDGEDVEQGGVALWEDYELRGFTPLKPAHLGLDYSKPAPKAGPGSKHHMRTRVERMLAAGKVISAALDRSGLPGLRYYEDVQKFSLHNDTAHGVELAACVEPDKVVLSEANAEKPLPNGHLDSESAAPPAAQSNMEHQEEEEWASLKEEQEKSDNGGSLIDPELAAVAPAPTLPALLDDEDQEEVILFRPTGIAYQPAGTQKASTPSWVTGMYANGSVETPSSNEATNAPPATVHTATHKQGAQDVKKIPPALLFPEVHGQGSLFPGFGLVSGDSLAGEKPAGHNVDSPRLDNWLHQAGLERSSQLPAQPDKGATNEPGHWQNQVAIGSEQALEPTFGGAASQANKHLGLAGGGDALAPAKSHLDESGTGWSNFGMEHGQQPSQLFSGIAGIIGQKRPGSAGGPAGLAPSPQPRGQGPASHRPPPFSSAPAPLILQDSLFAAPWQGSSTMDLVPPSHMFEVPSKPNVDPRPSWAPPIFAAQSSTMMGLNEAPGMPAPNGALAQDYSWLDQHTHVRPQDRAGWNTSASRKLPFPGLEGLEKLLQQQKEDFEKQQAYFRHLQEQETMQHQPQQQQQQHHWSQALLTPPQHYQGNRAPYEGSHDIDMRIKAQEFSLKDRFVSVTLDLQECRSPEDQVEDDS
eukprot:SM000098S25134  [mRNA]  locus=s98:421074:426494:+ [translate_table: standard]